MKKTKYKKVFCIHKYALNHDLFALNTGYICNTCQAKMELCAIHQDKDCLLRPKLYKKYKKQYEF